MRRAGSIAEANRYWLTEKAEVIKLYGVDIIVDGELLPATREAQESCVAALGRFGAEIGTEIGPVARLGLLGEFWENEKPRRPSRSPGLLVILQVGGPT